MVQTHRCRRALVVVIGIAALGASCEDSAAAPERPVPPGLEACVGDLGDRAVEAGCLDAIQTYLATSTASGADGGPTTHGGFLEVVSEVTRTLAEEGAYEHSYSLETSIGDDVGKSTAPLQSTWTVGSTHRTLWACFDGPDVTVSESACAGGKLD